VDKISTLYANAVKKCPGNEDFLTHLFMSYVRINDFKTQQTVALQLFKAKPKNPYYIWAVMSVVLQAIAGPDNKNEQKAKMLLALAERMMDKLINEKRLDAEQEIQLYISILQYQRKYEETLTFLDSEVCQKYYAGIPVTVKMELLIKLDKWVELNKLMKELLTQE
jgi:N-terminal acetyltransferase B complex non-catalytic subunit